MPSNEILVKVLRLWSKYKSATGRSGYFTVYTNDGRIIEMITEPDGYSWRSECGKEMCGIKQIIKLEIKHVQS